MNEKLEALNQEIEKTEKKLRPDKDANPEGTDAPALYQSRHAGKLPSPPGNHHG